MPDAGRLWLAGKHYVGPDPTAAMAAVGATVMVCLNEEVELRDRYPDYVRWLRSTPTASAVWWPIPDLHAPSIGDAISRLDDLSSRLRRNEGLLVHCGAGVGRAGTIAVALLLRAGLELQPALDTVAHHRPMAGPQTAAQSALLVEVARRSGQEPVSDGMGGS